MSLNAKRETRGRKATGQMPRVSARISQNTLDSINRGCIKNGWDLSAMVRVAIEKGVRYCEKEGII